MGNHRSRPLTTTRYHDDDLTTVGMPSIFAPFKDSTILSPHYARDFPAFYGVNKGLETNRQIEGYLSTRIPQPSRVAIQAEINTISNVELEKTIYEPLCTVLNRACLDLARPNDETVLIFIENSRKGLQTMPGTNTEMPDLVGFFVARDTAEKIVSGILKPGNAGYPEAPPAQELVCVVECKCKADADKQCKRYLFVLSRHRPSSSMQYGFIANKNMIRLIGLGLDEELVWPEVEWAMPDCIEKLYAFLSLVLEEAKKPIGFLVPRLYRVLGWKKHTFGLYTVNFEDRQFLLSEIFAGRGNGRKTFVAVGAEKGKPEEARTFKYSWCTPGRRHRERRILEKLVGVPGVVQVDSDLSRDAIVTDEESGRQRNLLVLKTVGFSLTSCESIRAFLEAMYDLLEGERPILA